MDIERAEAQTDVRGILRMLWRRRLALALTPVVCVLASLGWNLNQPELYSTFARARYTDPGQNALFGAAQTRLVNPEIEGTNERDLARSDPVIARYEELIGDRGRGVRSVTPIPQPEQQVMLFEATGTDPALAQAAADAYATAYVEIRRASVEANIRARADELARFADDTGNKISALDAEIATMDGEIAAVESRIRVAEDGNSAATENDRARRATLQTQRTAAVSQRDSLSRTRQEARTRTDQLSVEAAVQGAGAAIVTDRAGATDDPISPTPKRDAIMAGVVGILAGLGLAFARDYFDDRLHDPDEITRVLSGVPVLGVIPRFKAGSPSEQLVTVTQPASPTAEAFRSVRTTIEFARIASGARSIVVTSAVSAEGKSTTAANLAVSLAAAGSTVTLVDGDLRHPTVDRIFGVPREPGFTSVLLRQLPVARALHHGPAMAAQCLGILAAGPPPPNPSELLGAVAVGELVSTMREAAEYVIIDTPPLLAVSDAGAAARWADGVVLVAQVGLTRRRQLAAAANRLRQLGCPLLGVIVTAGAPPRSYGNARYYAQPAAVANGSAAVWSDVVARPYGASTPMKDAPPQRDSTLPAERGDVRKRATAGDDGNGLGLRYRTDRVTGSES